MNAKCKIQNECIGYADELKTIAEGDTITLHFAFCICCYKSIGFGQLIELFYCVLVIFLIYY